MEFWEVCLINYFFYNFFALFNIILKLAFILIYYISKNY